MDLATLRQASSASLDADHTPEVAKSALLPPSPPMTDTSPSMSTDSSPATFSPVQEPAATPPRSYDRRPSHSSSPASPSSPLPPFPVEVFANILSCLPTRTIAQLCRVSRAWNQHISSDSRLWSTLVTRLDADEDVACEYICSRASMRGGKRSTGGIRDLHIILGYARGRDGVRVDCAPPEYVMQRLYRVVGLVEKASLPNDASPLATSSTSSLRSLHVEVWPNTPTSLQVLDIIGKCSLAPVFNGLQRVRFRGSVPSFDLRGSFLQMWPTVTSFTFIALRQDASIKHVDGGTWAWHNPAVHLEPRTQSLDRLESSLDRLESLELTGVYIGDIDFPRLPALKHLVLRKVDWEGRGLFHLLRLARRTLESIQADDLTFEPVPDPYDDWFKHVDVSDASLVEDYVPMAPADDDLLPDAAPILLPALRALDLIGCTPPFFATIKDGDSSNDDDSTFPSPILRMPNLDSCFLHETNVDTEYEHESLGPLAVLGQNAPRMKTLTLNGLIVHDWAVHCCLAGMHATVTTLDLYQSSVSDHLVVQLPQLVPCLKVLDVRQCDEVTPQGVARMVEVMRGLHDEGQSKIERVLIDPPTHRGADVTAYRWLDFVGVLERDELDYEGDGPPEPGPRRRWIRDGKKDVMWEYKHEVAAREAAECDKRAAAFLAYQASVAGGSSSAAGPPTQFASAMVMPSLVSAPPFGPQSRTAPPSQPYSFALSQPAPLPATQAHLPLQPIPLRKPQDLPGAGHGLPPHLARQSSVRSPAAQQQADVYTVPPPALAPAPAVAPAPAPPVSPAPAPPVVAAVAQDEADVDYSFLDGADGGAAHLNPEFVRAQEAAFARLTAGLEQRRASDASAAAARAEAQAEEDRRVEAHVAAVLVAAQQQRGARELQEGMAVDMAAHANPPAEGDEAVDDAGVDLRGFADDSPEDDADEMAPDEPFTPLV